MKKANGSQWIKRKLMKTWAVFALGMASIFAPPGFAQNSPPASDDESRKLNQDPMHFEQVDFESMDTEGFLFSKRVPIKGYLALADSKGPTPAAILNPACEGLLIKDAAQIKIKYRQMAHVLHRLGISVLLVDGFNPRGFSETCAKQLQSANARLMDAFGGLEYLRSRKDIDGRKIVLVSWGANGSLEGMSEGGIVPKGLGTGFAGAVLYYPECAKAGSSFAPYAPIQVFVGEKDSWNPAYECHRAAARQKAGSSSFRVKVYPDAYHSFDSLGTPRMNSYNPKLGMVGRHHEAALDSYVETEKFLSDLLALTPKNPI